MLFGNAMEVALLKAGLIIKPRKRYTPKIHTFTCRKCKGDINTIPFTNVAACENEKCGNYIIFY